MNLRSQATILWTSPVSEPLPTNRCLSFCHSLWESASSPAVAVVFLSVLPSGNLLLPRPLPLSFFLSFPLGICFFPGHCRCLSFCHSLWESASSPAVAVVFLSVIPSGNLLLPRSLPLSFFLSFPLGICCLPTPTRPRSGYRLITPPMSSSHYPLSSQTSFSPIDCASASSVTI